jgi:hypothetical protein
MGEFIYMFHLWYSYHKLPHQFLYLPDLEIVYLIFRNFSPTYCLVSMISHLWSILSLS